MNTNWPLHKPAALEELKTDCLRRGVWREEENYVRRGPFPPPDPTVDRRELSVDDEGDGHTYLKVQPLHATRVVYETGDADPTPASSPVPAPERFQAKGLRYRFLAVDPNQPDRIGAVREWTAKLRLKYPLHHRADHYEVELLALPKANGLSIRYTTDGSSPESAGCAAYAGPFRVPGGSRVVCALATAVAYDLKSEIVRIPIPQQGDDPRELDRNAPALWKQALKLDDAGTVWDFIKRLEGSPNTTARDIGLTAESGGGQQYIEYSGTLEGGYTAPALQAIADKLQEIAGEGSLRMSVGSLHFPTGQALLDWLRSAGLPFDLAKASQPSSSTK